MHVACVGIPWLLNLHLIQYAEAKEAELWSIFHDELDLDGNGRLDAYELRTALAKAGTSMLTLLFHCLPSHYFNSCVGITLQPSTLSDFMNFLSSSQHPQTISFSEFRDFLILMPRKASTIEIYRYYEFRKNLGDDGHGNARVNMEGQWSLSLCYHADPIRPSLQVMSR